MSTINFTNITNNNNFNLKVDYYILSGYKKYNNIEKDSSQKIIRKYWYNYIRNIYRTCIFRDELLYLPNIGIKYFEGLARWNNTIKKL